MSALPSAPPAPGREPPTPTPGPRLGLTALHTGITIAAARSTLTRAFEQAGLETPALDARVLMQHALDRDHAALAASSGRLLLAHEGGAIAALAERRLAREPIAHIVGFKEFWGLPLRVTAATLTPRPETETVVEAALSVARRDASALRVADLGTGTGALLLALLSELPLAQGMGVDISSDAIAVARANACALGLATRAQFVVGDFTAPLAGPFDLVVSNPPYVESDTIRTLAPEVRDHEPHRALDGGADGLAFYRRLAADASRITGGHGHVVVEIGAGQAEAVVAIFARHGFDLAQPASRDLAGIERALILRPR